jgi:hypothetical protein
MRNRRIARLAVIATMTGCLAALSSALTEASHQKDYPKKHKIVYQLTDAGADKAKFVLRNIQNHVKGVGGWNNIEALELVVFGPALKTFVTKGMDAEVKRGLETLQTQGLVFGACGNTMKNFSIALEELPDGSRHLPQGGVVRIMELQDAGYSYIRP